MSKTTTGTRPDFADEIMTALGRVLVALVLGVFELVWLAVLFPMVSVPAGLSVAAGWFYGWPVGVGVAGVAVAGMVLWRVSSPQTFERWLTLRARARWLAWFRYRRRWAALLTACELATRDGDRVSVPKLTEVLIGETTDIVRARMLPGHSPDSWTHRAEHLAHGFGAQNARVRIAGPGLVEITFRISDSLTDPVVVPFESLAGFKTLPDTKAA